MTLDTPPRPWVSLLLPLLLMASPAVAADAPAASAEEGGSDECVNLLSEVPIACGIYARASWEVVACDESTCTLRMASHANGWSQHLGVLRMETVSLVDNLACERMETPAGRISDAACIMFCRTTRVSWTSSCVGTLTPRLALAAGECVNVSIGQGLYNEATGSKALVVHFKHVCRTAGGAPYFVG
jgi:hypothetical protein